MYTNWAKAFAKALESETVLLEAMDGEYGPLGENVILRLSLRIKRLLMVIWSK